MRGDEGGRCWVGTGGGADDGASDGAGDGAGDGDGDGDGSGGCGDNGKGVDADGDDGTGSGVDGGGAVVAEAVEVVVDDEEGSKRARSTMGYWTDAAGVDAVCSTEGGAGG